MVGKARHLVECLMADNAHIGVTLSTGMHALLVICEAFFVHKKLTTGFAATAFLRGRCVLLFVS